MPPLGYLGLVLHAHLPFVRHPEHERFLEEDWLFEGLTECYLPLVDMLDRLDLGGVPGRLGLSLTPTLLSMLGDSLLQRRFLGHLDRLIELARSERQRTRTDPRYHPVARMYLARLGRLRRLYLERYRGDLIGAFRSLQERGRLELLTSAATHAYLPLMAHRPQAMAAQIRTAVALHRKLLGRPPAGIWLPECGYLPAIEPILRECGLRYICLDAHGLLHARPLPRYGVYAPVSGPSGVAAFGRDLHSSRQVWSAEVGYPGDPLYRDFYRDIGFDLDPEYVGPWLQATGDRKATGLKYHRITGPGDDKAPYEPWRAARRAAEHATHFVDSRRVQVAMLADWMPARRPFVLAPYDAELFGHWWFEGPLFLEQVLRQAAARPELLACESPGGLLAEQPELQQVELAMSSWGERGYSEMWLNESNDWIYNHLDHAAARMIALAKSPAEGLVLRTLNQAARELMLAQASDWAFIMRTGTSVGYAVARIVEHLQAFGRLAEMIDRGRVEEPVLTDLEQKHNLFPEIDYRCYREDWRPEA
jgi:1,4-alpha-glucan branching enzyme